MFWNFRNVGIQANTEIRSLLKDLINKLLAGHDCEDIIPFRILAKFHASSYVLYNGTGAILITLGSLQSAITPAFDSASKISFPLSVISKETWQPLSSSFRGVIISIIFSEEPEFIPSNKNHKYLFSSFCFTNIFFQPASSKILRDAFCNASDKKEGVLNCQPSAVGIGLKPFSILNRVALSYLHQPA